MYGYEEHIEITPEQILQKITQQQIFEWILEVPFDINARYCSPLRDDKKPDCRFEERPDGTIVFVDFGERHLTGKTHRSCFSMVMDFFNVSLSGAIREICKKFGLSTDADDYQVVDRIVYEKKEQSSPTEMTYIKREPDKLDRRFWSQFIITPEDLAEDNSYCVLSFTIKNHKGFRRIVTYRYCYVFDFIDKIKIYQPFKDKYKWITNCDENCIGNFDNLPPTGKELIIQKSYKDHRVLRNIGWGLNVVWFQNEGCVPSLEILKNITERFNLITIFYDNDEDGIKAAQKLVDIFNMLKPNCARMIYMPRKRRHKQLFGNYLKDPGEFVQKEGRQDLMTALKSIGIYGKDS